MAMRRLMPAIRSAAFGAIRPPRFYNQRAFLNAQPMSLMPWRKGSAATQQLPVYFARPDTGSRLKPVRRFVGRVLFTTATAFICWTVFYVVVLEPLFDWAEDEWDALSEKEKQELTDESDEGADSILFLPMPFSTIEVKQKPYKNDDPNWLEFVAFNRSQQTREDVKFKLAEIIRQAIASNDQYIKLLGGKDIRISQFWLDTIFPSRPPPKHYVAGISIEDDGVYWGHRPIDTLAANHLSLAIYPAAVAKAAWSFVSVLGKGLANDAAVFFGLAEPSVRPPAWQDALLNRMPGPDIVTRGANQITGGAGAGAGAGSNGELQDLKKTLQSAVSLGNILPPSLDTASTAAMVTFAKSWKPARPGIGPGCIKVDGLIQVSGKQAYMAVYVNAWYDVKQRKFVDIQTQLKHILPYKQYPARK